MSHQGKPVPLHFAVSRRRSCVARVAVVALWIVVAFGTSAIAQDAASHAEEAARAIGLPPGDKRFHPHLTLA